MVKASKPPAAGLSAHASSHVGYTRGAADEGTSPPSGCWKGYYTYSGCQFDVAVFYLTLQSDGLLKGEGTDDVGGYSISGRHSGRRLAFSKAYLRGSRNSAGRVSQGNQGHTVEYRGELAEVSAGAGYRGSWSITSLGLPRWRSGVRFIRGIAGLRVCGLLRSPDQHQAPALRTHRDVLRVRGPAHCAQEMPALSHAGGASVPRAGH